MSNYINLITIKNYKIELYYSARALCISSLFPCAVKLARFLECIF